MAKQHTAQLVKHGGNDITGAKSVTFDEATEAIFSQADGSRGRTIIGELATETTFSLELEAEALDFPGTFRGLSKKASLEWTEQDSNDPLGLTGQKYTITNAVLLTRAHSTVQDASPNSDTWSGQAESPADGVSIVAVTP